MQGTIQIFDKTGGTTPFVLELRKTHGNSAITLAICRKDGLRELGPPWIAAISVPNLRTCADKRDAEILAADWRIKVADERLTIHISPSYMDWEVCARQREFRQCLDSLK